MALNPFAYRLRGYGWDAGECKRSSVAFGTFEVFLSCAKEVTTRRFWVQRRFDN